jgi:hypothetical protein
VQADPPSGIDNRTMLDLNGGPLRVKSIDWGDAAVTLQESQQGRYGSTASDRSRGNRTVAITVGIGMDDSGLGEEYRGKLSEKVALWQEEGGVLLRQRADAGGARMYADVVGATMNVPDVLAASGGGLEDDVVVTLECLPDFYGDEILLDAITDTQELTPVLELDGEPAVIKGDYPGRVRIIVTDGAGHARKSLIWGFRARHYDDAATAGLVYEAEDMTPINSASVVSGIGNASGGKVVQISALTPGTWHPMLVTDLLAGGQLTHIGAYRVWARCSSTAGIPQVKLAWSLDNSNVPEYNDPATIPTASSAYYCLDLGVVVLYPDRFASSFWWRGVLMGLAPGSGWDLSIDKLWLQPLDESAGKVIAASSPPAFALTESEIPTVAADDATAGSVAWTNVSAIPTRGYAKAPAVPAGGSTHYLKTTGFGFALPAGATIAGIKVQALYKSSSAQNYGGLAPSLMKAGSRVGSAAGVLYIGPYQGAYVVEYGGQTSLWGTTWSASDINNANFGASFQWTNPVGRSSLDFYLGLIQINVYYTTGGGFTVVQDAVVFPDQNAEIASDGSYRTDDGGVYAPIQNTSGDLPRIPPSGVEGRAVQLFVRPSVSDLGTIADGGADSTTVQVAYRPAYASRP